MRFAWAVVGSAWVHIVIAGVVLIGVRCMPSESAGLRPDRVTAVMLVSPDEARTAGEAKADGPGIGGAAGDDALDGHRLSADLEQGRLAALDPAAMDALAALSAGDLDALELSDLRALELDSLDAEALAALQVELDPLTLQRLAAALPADDPRLAALQPLTAQGLASPPRTDRVSKVPAPGTPLPAPADDEAPGADPLDAVADAALPDQPDPRKTPEDPEDREIEPDEDPEEPEPEPEPEDTTHRRWQKYLRADRTQALVRPGETEFISSQDAQAEELRRVEVTAEAEGPTTPPLDGLPIEAGTPSLELADGEIDEDGGDAPAAGEPVEERVAVERGGGMDGQEEGQGSPLAGEGKRGGAPARSGRRAAASASAVVLTGGDAALDGTKDAVRPDDLLARRQEGWWSPKVARIVIQAPETPPAEAPVTAALQLEQVAEAPEPKPDQQDDRGGTEQPVEVDEELPESAEEAMAPDTGEPDPEEPVEEVEEEPVESIADLRQAMGWGGMRQARTKPRRAMPGIAATDGNMRTSRQTVSTELQLDRFSAVEARDTPKGRYRASLDDEISSRWHTMDLSVHERALGIQGDVRVQFIVQRNGKVMDKMIVRSSGHPSLDAMATDAVPEKLPRIPREIDQDSFPHSYNFIYRNPIIVEGDSR